MKLKKSLIGYVWRKIVYFPVDWTDQCPKQRGDGGQDKGWSALLR